MGEYKEEVIIDDGTEEVFPYRHGGFDLEESSWRKPETETIQEHLDEADRLRKGHTKR